MLNKEYQNIANSFHYIKDAMLKHIDNVDAGGGIVTDSDIVEVVNMLEEMFNKNLYHSNMRVDFKVKTNDTSVLN